MLCLCSVVILRFVNLFFEGENILFLFWRLTIPCFVLLFHYMAYFGSEWRDAAILITDRRLDVRSVHAIQLALYVYIRSRGFYLSSFTYREPATRLYTNTHTPVAFRLMLLYSSERRLRSGYTGLYCRRHKGKGPRLLLGRRWRW